MKEVKSSTVVKCFAHCGVTGIDIAEDDDDDDVPLAELLRLTCPHIADPITTTEDYINIDNDLDANEMLDTDWEDTLLTDLTDNTSKDTCAEDDNEEETDDDPQQPELTNFAQAIHFASQLRQFCTSNDIPNAFELLSNLEDTLQAEAIHVKC
jgi:hypothetical protein